MKRLSFILLVMLLNPLQVALATDSVASSKDSENITQPGGAVDLEQLKTLLVKNLPQAANSDIRATPIEGIYEVVSGSKAFYMTRDARYVFDGDLIDLNTRRNLTEDVRSQSRKNTIKTLGEDNMLVYTPKGKTKHTLTVFTDIYCPYCRQLHDEMDQYMAAGVKIRYVFLPFKGQKSFNDSVSVWCADNQQQALDKAKAGEAIEAKTCDNPIEQHKALASALGIRGTPAIMFDDGELNPGYLPAAKVIEQLNGNPDL